MSETDEEKCKRLDDLWDWRNKDPDESLSKDQAIDLLEDCDHGFLTISFAKTIGTPFGVDPVIQTEIANTDDPRGLNLSGLRQGQVAHGVAADFLASQIAKHLNPEYRNPKIGRGSALRHACTEIRKRLEHAS
jgi:hypothetical protein